MEHSGGIFMSKKKKKTTTSFTATEVTEFLLQVATTAYVFIFLIAMPLLLHDKYFDIGVFKAKMFFTITGVFLAAAVPIFIVYLCVTIADKNKRGEKLFQKSMLNIPDYFAIAYLVVSTLSFVLSEYNTWTFTGDPDANYAWFGQSDWLMGYRSQLLFVLIYFFVSRFFKKSSWRDLLYCILGSSAIIYILGIMNRFRIDPLGVYEEISEYYIEMFISTLGQTSWYSSYMIIIIPIGMALFWYAEKKWEKTALGIYCFISFATFVTQNSDSAYLAMFVILAILFVVSFDSEQKMLRFFELVIIMLSAFVTMGLLYYIFQAKTVKLDTISMVAMQNPVMYVLLAIIAAIYILLKSQNRKGKLDIQKFKILQKLVIIAVPLCFIAGVALVIITTKQVANGQTTPFAAIEYLVFNDDWGNRRGFAWKLSVSMIASFNPLQFLFGVGPDCFANYGYEFFADRLQAYWGDLVLTCAHNEWVNILICEGFLGLAAYLGFFVSGAIFFYKERKQSPFLLAGTLCIVGYVIHNSLCYQQVICTPVVFILIALVRSIDVKKGENV